MKSLVAVALCLSLIGSFAFARIPHSYRQLQERDDELQSPNGLLNWFSRVLNRQQKRQQEVCYQDQYYDFVNNSTFGQNFCQVLGISYPNRTVVEEFTPVVTVTRVRTDIETENVLVRTTPVTVETVTVTQGQNGKRDAQITSMPRDVSYMQKSDYINMFRRQADNSTELPPDDNVIAASLSSACSCQAYVGTTVTETYTNQPNFLTLLGFAKSVTTVYTTRFDREITATVTVTESIESTPTAAASPSGDLPVPETNTTITADAGTESIMYVQTTGISQGIPSFPEASATESTSAPVADPTAPPFTCPEDNGRTISQMLGTERFDYDVYCDKDLPSSSETDIPLELSYDSFAQCVAACSLSNAQFPGGPPVCQGVAYFEASGNNCILKSAANVTDSIAAPGVDIAILKRIAVGVDEENTEGTSTETVTPDEPIPTYDAADLGSMLSTIMGGSTTSVPIYPPAIVTGRPAMDGVTAYSTYISDGQTYSTGSVFSTYFSGNGSWYFSYFSAWSLAWTDAQTIYAAGETTVPVVVNNTGVTEDHNGSNGEYSVITTSNTTTITYQTNQTIYDTTQLIGNNTYDANGTQIFATTTTTFYTYTLAAEGANGGSDAGVITSTAVSQFSTQSVIYSSGATGGSFGGKGSGNVVIQTPGPTLVSTAAFSTQTVVLSSGGLAGGEGSQGGGAAGSTVPEVGVTSTITSAFSTQIVITSPGNTAGGEGGEGSGGQGSVVPVTIDSSVILVTGGTAYSTGYVISGGTQVNGTSGATGAVGSGAVETNGPITSAITEATVILSTGGTGGFFSTGGQGSGAGDQTSGATSTSRAGFSNRSDMRSGTESDSTSFPATETLPSVTGPAPYPPESTISSGIITSLNVSLPVSTGTAPGSISVSGTGGFTSDFGSGVIPSPPISTGPSSGLLPPSNSSLPVPTGTSSVSFSFSNSAPPRAGTTSTSIPPVSLPSPITGEFPSSTGPVPYPPIIQTLSFPSGTGPIPYLPLSSAPSASIPTYNSSLPVPTGTSPPTNVTLPVSTGASSSSYSRSVPSGLRSGTESLSTESINSRPPVIQTLPYGPFPTPSGTGSSIALSTGGPFNITVPPSPTGTAPPATSCPSQEVSTTTMWAVTTLFYCTDKCPPGANGGYGGGGFGGFGDGKYQGPQSFGPPAAIFAPTLVGNPNPSPTSPAETSG
ncbi:hypothetical protein MBLNU13_g02122t1 [Cladosporium sp. NU13]